MTAMTDDEITALYPKIVSPDAVTRYDQSDGWFARYNGNLADPSMAERYVRSVRNKLGEFAENLERKTVLDIGCGFGMTCTTVAAMGAKDVHGIDNYKPMVDTFAAYAKTLPFADRLHPAKGPADQLPYDAASFDIVLTVEALSHIANTDGYMAEVHRVLKPGGVLLIADDNNAANPKVVQRNREIWELFENGPANSEVHGHTVRLPYVQSRQRILGEAFPELSADEIETLSLHTAYMKRDEIVSAARRYIEERELPGSRYTPDRCPIQPETGHTMESLLDPYDLKENLARLGFRTKVAPYFFGEGRGGLTYQTNNMISSLVHESLLFRFCEGLRVTAIKV